MKAPSQSSITQRTLQRHVGLDEEVVQSSEVEEAQEAQLSEAVVLSKEQDKDEGALKVVINTMTIEVVVEAEAEDLAGKTTTSHNEIETPQSIFDQTGP